MQEIDKSSMSGVDKDIVTVSDEITTELLLVIENIMSQYEDQNEFTRISMVSNGLNNTIIKAVKAVAEDGGHTFIALNMIKTLRIVLNRAEKEIVKGTKS